MRTLPALLLAASFAFPVPASAGPPSWAPAASATVHPGVQTFTGGQQCTANFVFTDSAGDVYLGSPRTARRAAARRRRTAASR